MAYKNETGLPSVSDIIRPYINTQYFTDECQIRGTAVHACCASYLQGLYFPRLKPEYQGYMDSFKKWADENVVEVVLVEKRLVDEDLGYCGKLDAVLCLKGHGKLCIVDWKTGKALQKSWILSIAAYAALEAHEQQLGIDAYVYSGNQENFNIFKGMLKSYQFFKRKGAM